ncbi:MAG: hypothetical protein ACO2O2_17350 [Acidilobaceae archaeon]
MGKPIDRTLDRIVDFEIKKLLSDLSWVEYRLALLGGSEEDEIERRLLNVLKKSIVRDLELLLSHRSKQREAQAS